MSNAQSLYTLHPEYRPGHCTRATHTGATPGHCILTLHPDIAPVSIWKLNSPLHIYIYHYSDFLMTMRIKLYITRLALCHQLNKHSITFLPPPPSLPRRYHQYHYHYHHHDNHHLPLPPCIGSVMQQNSLVFNMNACIHMCIYMCMYVQFIDICPSEL